MNETTARKMFGCTVEALTEAYNESLSRQIFLMGILSDAQEADASGNVELARQYMNRAKYIISYMPATAFMKIGE
jgi:hypothetical protein